MSYCVNCGVELDSTGKSCPLCSTPVNNPVSPMDTESLPPYPMVKGTVDPVKRSDLAILLSVILISTGAACGLLNLLIFKGNLWSLYIIGACALLWIFCIPILIYRKLSIYLTIIFDGIAIALYCYIIYYQFSRNHWYFLLALPIIVLVFVLILIFTFFIRYFKTSILSTGVLIMGELAVLVVGIELMIRNFLEMSLGLSWSAVVLTCCIVINIALITILKRARLREEVRKRMHM